MKFIHVAFIVAATAAMLMLVFGLNANARGGFAGSGLHSSRGLHYSFRPNSFHHLHAARRHGNFSQGQFYGNQWPFYAGLYAVPPYDADSVTTGGLTERVVFVLEPPRALTCKHSVETVTVRAEAGGTRDITITRC